MGPMGGPMDFGRSKSKFQEIPETGVMFDQVAGCDQAKLELQVGAGQYAAWRGGGGHVMHLTPTVCTHHPPTLFRIIPPSN